MIPMNRSSFGRAGGSLRRYPGGTENASIFATFWGRSRIAALPRAGSALPRTLLVGPARTVPRLSSLPPPTSSVEGYLVMEFYSGATALPGRFTEGFLHRRLHDNCLDLLRLDFDCSDITQSIRQRRTKERALSVSRIPALVILYRLPVEVSAQSVRDGIDRGTAS
jgi:hypothetical protein